jgi:hypothetical protein
LDGTQKPMSIASKSKVKQQTILDKIDKSVKEIKKDIKK